MLNPLALQKRLESEGKAPSLAVLLLKVRLSFSFLKPDKMLEPDIPAGTSHYCTNYSIGSEGHNNVSCFNFFYGVIYCFGYQFVKK